MELDVMSDPFEDRIFRACINDFYQTIVRTSEVGWPAECNLRDFFIGMGKEMAKGQDGIETSLLTMANYTGVCALMHRLMNKMGVVEFTKKYPTWQYIMIEFRSRRSIYGISLTPEAARHTVLTRLNNI
jgi:hypothetical protein